MNVPVGIHVSKYFLDVNTCPDSHLNALNSVALFISCFFVTLAFHNRRALYLQSFWYIPLPIWEYKATHMFFSFRKPKFVQSENPSLLWIHVMLYSHQMVSTYIGRIEGQVLPLYKVVVPKTSQWRRAWILSHVFFFNHFPMAWPTRTMPGYRNYVGGQNDFAVSLANISQPPVWALSGSIIHK